MKFGRFSIKIKKETLAIVVLTTLISVLNGAAGAQIIWGISRAYLEKRKRKKEWLDRKFGYGTLRVVLHRLQKDGLVKKGSSGVWQITKQGESFVTDFQSKKKQKPVNKTEDIVIVFDIPEKERKKRNYLRLELVSLGFRQLQKSVWIGASPLPEDFLEYLRQLQLFNKVHIFSIKSAGTIHI